MAELRPLRADDAAALLEIEASVRPVFAARLRGRMPSVGEYESRFLASAHSFFTVVDGAQTVGFAAVTDWDGHARIGAVHLVLRDDRNLEDHTKVRERLFEELFSRLRARKFYDDSPSLTDPMLVEALRERLPYRTEGLLLDHYVDDEGLVHKPVASVSESDWLARPQTLLPLPSSSFEPPDATTKPNVASSDSDARTLDLSAMRRPLVGRHVELRPIRQRDYEGIHVAELSPELGPLWRHRGKTPSAEQFVDGLWRGVTAQFLVVDRANHRPSGLVSLYDVDADNGFGYLAVARLGDAPSPFGAVAGAFLLAEYAFTCWPLRKLYADSNEFSFAQYASGLGHLFRVEAELPERVYYAGRRWSQFKLATTRQEWEMVSPRYLRFMGADVPSGDVTLDESA